MTVLPMIIRWISDVPSKIVKLSGVATGDQEFVRDRLPDLAYDR